MVILFTGMETEKRRYALIFSVVVVLFVLQVVYQDTKPREVMHYNVEILEKHPHDPDAFTQGLVYHEGYLIEGTGLYGKSSLRQVNIETGEVHQELVLDEQFFGEGVTILGDRIYQLTWKEEMGFILSTNYLLEETFTYDGEGWGLTHDGGRLIMSNGSSTISFHDPETYQITKTIDVLFDDSPVLNLNELEYIDGVIYANVWQTDQIVMVDPSDGSVLGWIDLASLRDQLDPAEKIDVLNGIAYNSENGSIYVTGKWWPNLFEVKLVPE